MPLVSRYPHITWTICTPHAIDLTLEEIFAIGPFDELISKAKRVVMFINNHQQTLAAYRALEESVLALLKPGETRFATSFIMLQRVHKQSSHLQRLVVSQGWQSAVARLTAEDRGKAAEIKLVILDDNFWEEAKEVCCLLPCSWGCAHQAAYLAVGVMHIPARSNNFSVAAFMCACCMAASSSDAFSSSAIASYFNGLTLLLLPLAATAVATASALCRRPWT
jgi:hypothetical protein